MDFDQTIIDQVVHTIRKGDLVILPTETVYGIMLSEKIPSAWEKLYALKGRDAQKPLQRLVSSWTDIKTHGAIVSPEAEKIAQAFWPGPLTLVLPHPRFETVGYRMPDHPFVLKVIENLGEVLPATSANPSGQAPACDAPTAKAYFHDEITCIIDGGVVDLKQASTVLRISEGEPEILREGIISKTMIMEVLKERT